MTYKEAEYLLSTLDKNPYLYEGQLHTAFIVPESVDDRLGFLADLKERKINADNIKKYSTNKNYVIYSVLNSAFNL